MRCPWLTQRNELVDAAEQSRERRTSVDNELFVDSPDGLARLGSYLRCGKALLKDERYGLDFSETFDDLGDETGH